VSTSEVVSLAAAIVSLIVSILAIGLSVYFYTQSKNTETSVSGLLEGIRAQTDALQKIVGKQMSVLIRNVTEQPNLEFSVYGQMISAIREIPGNMTTLLQMPTSSERAAHQSAQEWRQESLKSYIIAFYYSALSNMANQVYLPPLNQLEGGNIFKRIIDSSHADFTSLDTWFSAMNPQELRASPLHGYYTEALGWKPFVKDSTAVYAERAAVNNPTQ
jgi:hypothetical protein